MTTPVYVKTVYTFLSSLITIDDLIAFGKQNNLSSLCICDDNMYGVMEFMTKALEAHIKPVIGVDFDCCLLYAKNYQGYQNLLKLTTIKSKQEVTLDDLLLYHDNLICVIPFDKLEYYDSLKDFYDDLYIGFTKESEREIITERGLMGLYCKKTLCLNDDDLLTLKYLSMLRDNKTVSDDYDFFSDVVVAKGNDDYQITIQSFLDKCQLALPHYALNLPNYMTYNDTKGLSSDEYLYHLSVAGLIKRLDNQVPIKYQKRLVHELNVIKEMGFSNYFLIVYDYIRYAKQHNILVGPGRGSAAGSLVSYSLGITEVDPIKYDLLFERFLNSERVTMPDIDTDFPDLERDQVIEYVKNKYGLKKVAGIITFGTFGSKMALRDMGRVMNVPLYTIDELCRLIKNNSMNLATIKETNNKFQLLIDSDLKLKKLFQVASKLEGLPRHTSIHPAGIIMANDDLDDIVPLTYNDGMYLSGYEAGYLENLGLLKMDFLGLKNLTTIEDALNLIKKEEKISLTFNDLPLDDERTNEVFQQGDTSGIFQFESSGMRDFLRKLHPVSFMDIYNANAFYRPGPSDNIPLLLKRRAGEAIDYLADGLYDILKSTYGIIVYQEQIMLIAVKMASFTLGEADILRRAMSKKKLELLTKYKEQFIASALKNGYSVEVSEKVYNLILQFASYGFNKSHSVAYSMISYKMAYLKANYPLYFYVALLNSVTMDDNKTLLYIKEMKAHDIKIVKPDINLSFNDYRLYHNKVILPFTLIKGISHVMSDKIIATRGNGFDDIYDFFSKAIINGLTKSNITSLIDSGALDSFQYTRASLYENLDSLMNYGGLTKDLNKEFVLKPELVLCEEFSKDVLIAEEKNSYGFYLTNHPVSLYKSKYADIVNLRDAPRYFNRVIKTIVIIDKINEVVTKQNEKMAFVLGSDEETSFDFVLFPKVYSTCLDLKKGDIILMMGKIERRNEYQMIVQKIEKVDF